MEISHRLVPVNCLGLSANLFSHPVDATRNPVKFVLQVKDKIIPIIIVSIIIV
jgi:hypothetical protein